MLQDHMKPVDVGAPRLIPQGNLSDHPASYAGMRKALDAVQTSNNTRYSLSGICTGLYD